MEAAAWYRPDLASWSSAASSQAPSGVTGVLSLAQRVLNKQRSRHHAPQESTPSVVQDPADMALDHISPSRRIFLARTGAIFRALRVAEIQTHHRRFPGKRARQSVFMDEEDEGALFQTTLDLTTLMEYSYSYKKEIAAQIARLYDTRSTPSTAVQQELAVFQTLKAAWGLMEVLFLGRPGDGCSARMQQWVHDNEPDQTFYLLTTAKEKLSKERLWHLLYKTTLQGRFKSAQRTLSALMKEVSSSEQFSQTKAMQETLRLLDTYPNAATDMFKQRFKRWSDNCQLLLATLDHGDTQAKPLYDLLRILSGEKAAIREHAAHWKDEVIGTLLFAYPTMTVNELGDLVELVVPHYKDKMEEQLSDDILYSLLTLNLAATVRHLMALDLWGATHITDMLASLGQLDDVEKVLANDATLRDALRETACLKLDSAKDFSESFDSRKTPKHMSMREWLVTSYACSLISASIPQKATAAPLVSLWEMGADYLSFCATSGRKFAYVLLPQVLQPEKDTDTKAKRLLTALEEANLPHAAEKLACTMGRVHLSRQRWGQALLWFFRTAEDIGDIWIGRTVEGVLRAYQQTGDMTDIDLLVDHLGKSCRRHPQLSFLFHYRDFHTLFTAGDYEAAAARLVDIIRSDTAPFSFIFSLFLDVLPLLNESSPTLSLFTEEDLYDLMGVFQRYLDSPLRQQEKSTVKEDEQVQHELIQMAFCKALANIHFSDGQLDEEDYAKNINR